MSLNANSLSLFEQATFNLASGIFNNFLPTIWGIRLQVDGSVLTAYIPSGDTWVTTTVFLTEPIDNIGLSKNANEIFIYTNAQSNVLLTFICNAEFYNTVYTKQYPTGFYNVETETFKSAIDGGFIVEPAQVGVINSSFNWGLGEELPFNYGGYRQGETILVFEDGIVISGTLLLDDDIKNAKYVVWGGTKQTVIDLFGAIAILQAGRKDLIVGFNV